MKGRSQARTAWCLIQIITCQVFILVTEAAINKLLVPSDAQCACPGDVLTFTCTVVGPGNTLWSGTAFSCSSTGNEIILRHSQFATPGTSGNCNSGKITARSLGVENNCYMSELNVTASASLNNKTLQCQHNTVTSGTIPVNETALTVASAYPPPSDVRLTDIGQGQITFNWKEVAASCYSFDYVITSDCGICPPTTNATSATCSLQLPTETDGFMCSFSVSSRVCGITGDPNVPVILSAPGTPMVNIVPCYSNYSQNLQQLFITITMNSAAVTSKLNDIITRFSTSSMNERRTIPYQQLSCQGSVCDYTVGVPSAFCSPSKGIDVNVSASNMIGRSLSSNTTTIGCTNEVVRVNFNSFTSTLFCIFLNGSTESTKSCSITYWLCNQETATSRTASSVKNSSMYKDPNTILINLASLEDEAYCFITTAVIDITTIKVEGNLTKSTDARKNTLLPLVIALPLAIVSIIIIIIIVLLSVLVPRVKRFRRPQYKVVTELNPKEDKFIKVPKGYFKVKKVDSDKITLKELLKSEDHAFDWNKHNIFLDYDSIRSQCEDIRDIHVLLLDKATQDVYYYGGQGSKKMTELSASERHPRRNVFIVTQSKPDLVLEKDTFVIYENPKNYLKRRFHVLKVGEKEMQLSEFITLSSKLGLFDEERAFYELTEEEKEHLSCCRKMIRVSKKKLTQPNENGEDLRATILAFYTALGAPESPAVVSKSGDFPDFIHGVSQGSRHLQSGTYVLYEHKSEEVKPPGNIKAKEQNSKT